MPEEPEKTPPILDLSRANPPITEVITKTALERTKQINFSIPVRSEDLGDPLWAQLYLNYSIDGGTAYRGVPVPPSTLEDTSRAIVFFWTIQGLEPGCYQLSLVVTHSSNVDFTQDSRPIDPTRDVAIATWWMNVEQSDGTAASMAACPSNTGGGQ
jgi:hypothetical protein